LTEPLDLEPHEYRDKGERRTVILGMCGVAAALVGGLWTMGLLFDIRAWSVVVVSAALGAGLVWLFPRFFFGRY
jgi:hypothetical protein